MSVASSVPSISEFSPRSVKWQLPVMREIRRDYDYTQGMLEILLSGAVGSAKTILIAHILVTHCLLFEGAHAGIGRLTLPALKKTLLDKILKHMGTEVRYRYNKQEGEIHFLDTGSKISLWSWRDLNVQKFRSTEFSMFAVEELTETDAPDFYNEVRMRLGRLTHVKECMLISATNPDDPDSHWVYEDIIKPFEAKKRPDLRVYYSKTKDNIFLPASYISTLEKNLDPMMAQRMLEGLWVSISKGKIYHQYSTEKNFKACEYKVNEKEPIRIHWDFNIGEGKPMSSCLSQYIKDEWHFYDEAVVHTANTNDILDEWADRGIFESKNKFIIHGDCNGKNKDTRSNKSDYSIITEFLQKYTRKDGSRLEFEMLVPLSNPQVRKRHNIVNAYMQNVAGEVRLFVYEKCEMLDKGWRLTKLKKGAEYIEDDSKEYQHVTTAAGYGIMTEYKNAGIIEMDHSKYT